MEGLLPPPVGTSDWARFSRTSYWGEFARRALSGEKFKMKKMR